MQLTNRLFLALAAGTAVAAPALAQQADYVIPADRALPVAPGMIHGGGYANPGTYDGRVDLDVYQIGIPTASGGDFRSSGVNVYDDVTFGGPYTSNASPLTINGIALGFIIPTSATPADDHLYTLLSFYPNHDNTVAGTSFPYSGTPVTWNLDWGAGWSGGAGFIEYYAASVTFTGTVVLSSADVFNGGASDRTCGVKAQLFLDAAETRTADNWQIVRRGLIPDNGTNLILPVGSTDVFGWFSAATLPGTDITNSQRSGGAANSRSTYMNLQGTGFTAVAPPVDHDFGNLADGASTPFAITIPNDGIKWYRFAITADATDVLEHFLDIDTEGSTADLAMAVYDGNGATAGTVAQIDLDSGSGTNAQLSFGMGRRAAVGDGVQYDGRNFYNGLTGLAAGTYYLAVGPEASTFASGYGATGHGTGGAGTINFHTNVNGAALATSVAPIINSGDDLLPSPLVAPGAQFPGVVMAAYTPRWIRFTTCQDASPSNTVTFNWAGSAVATASVTFFDASGNFVNQQVYTGNGLPPSFVFDGATNALPAGTYYAGIQYGAVEVQPNNPATNGRWHLRATAGNDGFTFAGEIDVLNGSCAPPACCLADYNGDGDTGTDADIEAFFSCLAGNCCATCPQNADFNCDGDIGTDADIESFFRVLAGGNC